MAHVSIHRLVRSLRLAVEANRLDVLTDAELVETFRCTTDPAAFEAIVRRHGERVLAACHSVLTNPADVEDAFQATFFVLLREVNRIRLPNSLGGWLYGVAHRIGLQARSRKLRRGRAEARKTPCMLTEMPDLSWRESCAILHEELDRLPDVYRLPLLLCYLEGKSRDEAAGQLGVKPDVLRGRLERARNRLRDRLTRRGITLSAGLLTAVASSVQAEGPPAHLIQATLAAITGQASAAVKALVQGVTFAMITGKARLLTSVVLLVGLLLAGINRINLNAGAQQPKEKEPAPEAARVPDGAEKARADAGGDIFYSGRVLDHEGKPLAGARVYISGLQSGIVEFKPRTRSGPDGNFRFTVRREEFQMRGDQQPGSRVTIGATAPGFGAASVWGSNPNEREKLTLRLPTEQIVKGRVIDLQGQPVAGVQVSAHIRGGAWSKNGRPVAFDGPAEGENAPHMTTNVLPDDADLPPVVTDKDGRFTFRGLGKDWLYDLWFRGPTIEHRKALLVTRPQKPKQVPGAGVYTQERGMPTLIQYGCDLNHVAGPSKPILGVVRDKQTGKPVPGAQVGKQWTRDDEPWGWTTTDKEGRFRLEGMAWAVHELTVDPPANAPYLRTTTRIATDKPGTNPVKCDVELQRRRLVSGQVTIRVTGKPVSGWVEYRPLANNPNLKSAPFLVEARWPQGTVSAQLDKEGRFAIPALPGGGVLVVKADGIFLPASIREENRKPGILDANDPELLDTRPLLSWLTSSHAYRVLEVPAAEDATCNLIVDPGRTLALTALLPDGKPNEVWAFGLEPVPFDRGSNLSGGEGEIRALAEGERRRVFLQTTDAKFAGMIVLGGGERGPVKVPLRPTGTLTGRLQDAAGKPLPGQAFQVVYDDGPGRPGVYFGGGLRHRNRTAAERKREQRISSIKFLDKLEYVYGPEKSDDQGRFRLPGLFPEVAFDLKVVRIRDGDDPKQKGQIIAGRIKVARPTLKPGEVLDLGDLKVEDVQEK